MNKDLVFYVAASALAVGVGVFVFWGPSTGFRKRKVPVIGLKNLGFTCFLNSLLQALASCPIFIDWLELSDYGNCISQSLLNILKLLSTEAESFISGDESFSPSEVMHALRQNGWSISPGEQDAHELFHHLILTIEEESMKEAKSNVYGCLSDALLPVSSLPPNVVLSSKSLFSGVNKGDTMKNDSNKNLMAVRSMTTSTNIVSEPKSNGELNQLNIDVSGKGDLAEVDVQPKYDLNRNRKPSPFTGFLTSQTMCRECGFKSVLRYDKFDSLSLHLPPLNSGCLYHTLTQLLERFVTTEVVAGVSCDGCNKSVPPEGPTVKSTALKSLSIGKLPQCLCIHIPRTLIHENGEPYKRQDYVEFPEYLIMDPFTQNQMNMDLRLKKQNMCSTESASEVKLEMGDSESIKLLESNKNVKANGDIKIRKINHIYRIKAVVVHRGALQGGHFVTYRRGPLRSNTRHRLNQSHHTHGERRWYLTSDADVRDATLSEALKSPAYMLFYEKCAKDFENDVNNRPCTKSVPNTATY